MAAVVPWLATLFTTGGAAAGTGAAAAGATTAGISAGAAAAAAAASIGTGVLASKLLAPKTPNLTGTAPPTIDQAKQAQQTTDRLRQRRGVLASIYAGGSNQAAPQVAYKTLLGQ